MNEHVKDAIDASWSDPDASVDFLRKLRPGGPWTVSAIYPDEMSKRVRGDTGPVPTKTFSDVERLRAWIRLRSGIASLYFTVNRTRPLDKKPSEQDVTAVEFLHVDIDEDEMGKIDGDAVRKAAIFDRLEGGNDVPTPTFIIDSGGGIQAIWRLRVAYADSKERLECRAANKWLSLTLGGDSSTINLDRLLRLPGTVNLPNAAKRRRGRVPTAARLLLANRLDYETWEFGAVEVADAAKKAGHAEIGDADVVENLDAFAQLYGLPERLVTIIRDGRLRDAKPGDDSRSAWLFDLACGLVRCHVPAEAILGVLTDPTFGISLSVLEKPDPEHYAKRQIAKAQAMVGGQSFESDNQSPWPRQLDYDAGRQANNARNARMFIDERPMRLINSDEVLFELNPSGVWTEVKEPALRAEVRKTDSRDMLQVSDVTAMVKAVKDLAHTHARPFDWIEAPSAAPAPKDLVLFRNGVLDLASENLLPLDGSYFATAVPSVDYQPDAKCPTWLGWLTDRLDPSFHPTLQEWMGYIMVPDTTAHRFATFTGPPRSGKSTAKNIIEQLVGSEHIARKQLADMGKEFGLQDAVDKRLIVVPDAKDAPATSRGQALERILAVTGGDITGVPRKYLPPLSVKLLTRLLVLGNRQPAWIDESGALAARQIAIVFDRSFEGREDQSVEDRLMSELPGIANWALEGLNRLRVSKYKFTIGEAGRAAVAEVRRSASPALRFAEDCLEVTGNFEDCVLCDDVYDIYDMWALNEGTYSRGKNDLMEDLATSLHNVKFTQTRKLPPPVHWKGGEYRPRVLQGVKSVQARRR